MEKRKRELYIPIPVSFILKLIRRFFLKRKHKYGFKADHPDARDYVYRVRTPVKDLPESTFNRNLEEYETRYNQEKLGSCVANALTAILEKIRTKLGLPSVSFSRLFIYWIGRDDKSEDSGVSIRTNVKALNLYGACSEALWPYIIGKFAKTPTEAAFRDAAEHQILRYERIYPVTKEAIMDAVSRGFPVLVGIAIYESFESDEVEITGVVPMPKKCRENLLGWHGVGIWDYDTQRPRLLNSWGREWGDHGTFTLPWEFLLDSKLAKDFWVIYDME